MAIGGSFSPMLDHDLNEPRIRTMMAPCRVGSLHRQLGAARFDRALRAEGMSIKRYRSTPPNLESESESRPP